MTNKLMVQFRFVVWVWIIAGGVVLATLPWEQYRQKNEAWYRSPQGIETAQNILSWQSKTGSWPKNVDTSQKPYAGDPNDLHGTFDNSATAGEMRFLAKAFNVVGDARYRQAFLKALDHILQAQYPTGGWPQSYPTDTQYHRYITFNDGAMLHVMELLRDIADEPDYSFVDTARQKAAKAAFDGGIQCILKCQIKVNGKLTVWCAQHDPVDYSPRQGRPYELVSLSGSESVGIAGLLMSLDNPTPQIVEAVNAAAQWFESAKVRGIRIVRKDGSRVAVEDPNAPPLWARFYEIETNRPIFSDRDGVKKYNFNDIGAGRRNGYGWYGDWGQQVADDYRKWTDKWKSRLDSVPENSTR
jgi:pectate lyase